MLKTGVEQEQRIGQDKISRWKQRDKKMKNREEGIQFIWDICVVQRGKNSLREEAIFKKMMGKNFLKAIKDIKS